MIPCLVPTLLLTIALPHFSEGGSIDANYAESSSQSFKTPCWLCEVPKCKECLTSHWTQWGSCSSPCGKKGYQSRTRLVHHPSSCPNGSCTHLLTKTWRPCNRFCHNGGTPNRWFCSCPLNYIGDCCETGLLVCVEIWHRYNFKYQIQLNWSQYSLQFQNSSWNGESKLSVTRKKYNSDRGEESIF